MAAYHTPQQRSGGPRYGQGVLIGGYWEDKEQQRGALQAFVSTAEGGGLKASRWRERLAVGSAPAPLTTARADGCLHFGDLLQLRHAPSGAALAVDVHATANIGSELRAASFAAAASDPVAHTTFLLSPYVPLKPSPLEPTWDGDVVRWGQKLHVIVNPMAAGEPLDAGGGSAPLFLASAPLSVTAASKFTRHQLVGFTGAPSYSAVWTPQPIDPALRGSLEGAPVPPGTPLLLVHAATQAPLCLEEAAFANDYGVEREVTAHLVTRLGMQTGLAHLAKGDDLRALPKAALGPNHMCFVNGSDVVELPPGEGPHYDLEQLLADIAGDLAAHPGGFAALDTKLALLCDGGGQLEAGELLLALRQCGVGGVSEGDVCALVAEYAGSAPGRVAARVLLAALQQRAAA